MDFSLSDEQRAIRDSVERFVEKSYGFEHYLATLATPTQTDPAVWAQLADFGWLGLSLPESAGGFGGSAVDTMLVAEGLGAGLVIEPYIANAILSGKLVVAAGSADQQERLLGPLVAGTGRWPPAFTSAAPAMTCATAPPVPSDRGRLSPPWDQGLPARCAQCRALARGRAHGRGS